MSNEYEILFRLLEDPVSQTWGQSPRWQVEFHEFDGISVPVGLAWVAEYAEEYGGPTLLYLLVADGWRRQGIATTLIKECRKRWPHLQMLEAISDAGEALLEKIKGKQ